MCESSPVKLRIYTLLSLDDKSKIISKNAAYHTSIEIFQREYSFGCDGLTLKEPTFKKCVIKNLGLTDKTENQLKRYLKRIRSKWTSSDYHPLDHNCHHFSRQIIEFLDVADMPEFIWALSDKIKLAVDGIGVLFHAFAPPELQQGVDLIKGATRDVNLIPMGVQAVRRLAAATGSAETTDFAKLFSSSSSFK